MCHRKKHFLKGKSAPATSLLCLHNDGASQELEERSQVLSSINIGGVLGIFFSSCLFFQCCRSVLNVLGKEKLHSPVSGHLWDKPLKYAGAVSVSRSWGVSSGAKFGQAAAFNYFVYIFGYGAVASDGERNTAL